MRKQVKPFIVAMVVLSVLVGAIVAYAESGSGAVPDRPGPMGGQRGEVTAMSDTSITIVTSEGETIVANLLSETSVYILATQNEGTLSDVQVGVTVQIMGRPNQDGTVEALGIIITPAGDEVRGQVTGIDDTSISVESRGMPGGPPGGDMPSPPEGTPPSPPEGTPPAMPEDMAVVSTVVVGDSAQIYLDGAQGSLSDVAEGQFVDAFGETQADGSLLASVVIVSDEPQMPAGVPGHGGPGRGGPGGPPGPRQ